MEQRIGLILTGGGARAAYQVGVLKAIADMLPRRAHSPFHIICGTSSGSLNAATLAINAQHFRRGVQYLANIWKHFQPSDIYRTDVIGVFGNSARWFAALLFSGFGAHSLKRVSLLDNSPLQRLLDEILPCEKIQESIDRGFLYALSITASGYSSGQSVTFYQGNDEIQPWERARRIGVPTKIENVHLLASSAIPFLFPAVHIHREYFGDGSMRQIAPLSAALHLGATKVLVIGVGNGIDHPSRSQTTDDYPSLAQIAGHALNSIFLDHLEIDLERIQRVNRTLDFIPEDVQRKTHLRHVDALMISPTRSIEKIAERYAHNLPWTIRLLLRMIGVRPGSGANLISYLLSEKTFCRAVINMGYEDAMARKEEILAFLNDGEQPAPSPLPE